MADRPFVPITFSDEAEHRRKLAEAIVIVLNRLDEIEARLVALGG